MALDPILRRDRLVVALALSGVVALSWYYLWRGAGLDMPARDMSAAVLFPHLRPDVPGEMDAPWPLLVAMWWVMMVAMMTPGAAPLVLLYRRVLRHHARSATQTTLASTLLLCGYLATWFGFAVVAALVQQALQPTGLVSAMMWWSRSPLWSAALLAAAGAYQWSSWKQACLTQCRDPARFLAGRVRPGPYGAFALGVRHGAYCLGCCGLLMALLFVGGVMNVYWIAALSVLVLAEKVLAAGSSVSRITGLVLLAWSGATLIV